MGGVKDEPLQSELRRFRQTRPIAIVGGSAPHQRFSTVRVLALETSGRHGSIALLQGDGDAATVLGEHTLPSAERTAKSLLPAIEFALAEQSWRPGDLELICVTTGPGSFTGLRIGVVAAKTLAYATGAKLVGVHTLAAMAANISATGGRLWTVLDAQRQELFAARFDPQNAIAEQATPSTEIICVDAWLAQLEVGDAVAGPTLAKCRHRLPAGVVVVDESLWSPSAAATGRLGVALFARGVCVAPLELVPNYYRKSAAEEKNNPPFPSP
jgi:tRNA threonylcarbamoyladenosine biosynthesis protein TsaB